MTRIVFAVLAISSLLLMPARETSATQLKAKATAHSVSLTWTEPALGSGVPAVTSYNIYRGTTAGGEGTTPLASTTTPSYTDTAVVAGTTYFYEVAAVNSVGVSPMSNEVSGTIPNLVVPPAPTGLAATAQ